MSGHESCGITEIMVLLQVCDTVMACVSRRVHAMKPPPVDTFATKYAHVRVCTYVIVAAYWIAGSRVGDTEAKMGMQNRHDLYECLFQHL